MAEKLTICLCRWRKFIPQNRIDKVVNEAKSKGYEVHFVDDLCALIEDGDEKSIVQLTEGTIAACHERAVKSMLAWHGREAKGLVNLREKEGESGPGDDAWFPVIDKDRCTECGMCFDFCPFGVYEMVDGRVRVVHPHRCKNNCPSCARNCPSEAIIFPKYTQSPINGGTTKEEQAVRVDHSQLYAEAFRAKLKQRKNVGAPLLKVEKKDENQ